MDDAGFRAKAARSADASEDRGCPPRLRADGSVTIHQDASLYVAAFDPGAKITLDLAPGRRAWVQVLVGDVSVNGMPLAVATEARSSAKRPFRLRADESPARY